MQKPGEVGASYHPHPKATALDVGVCPPVVLAGELEGYRPRGEDRTPMQPTLLTVDDRNPVRFDFGRFSTADAPPVGAGGAA